MIAQLGDEEFAVGGFVDESVLVIDAARAVAGKSMF